MKELKIAWRPALNTLDVEASDELTDPMEAIALLDVAKQKIQQMIVQNAVVRGMFSNADKKIRV